MARKILLKVKKEKKTAVYPTYVHEGDVGMDVTVTDVKYDEKTDRYIYGTGLACATEGYYSMFAFPKSGIYKKNFYLTNSVGIIDTKTYRGEIKAVFAHRDSLENRLSAGAMEIWDKLPWYKKIFGQSYIKIKEDLRKQFMEDPCKFAPYQPGERAFQIWMSPVIPVEIQKVRKLDTTKRGRGGFGSTGLKMITEDKKDE